MLQVTYAMVKPDAVAAGKVQDIVDTIAASGLQVMQRKEVKLSADQVRTRVNITNIYKTKIYEYV